MNGKIVSVDVFLDKLREYIVDNDITKEELGRCLVDNAFDAMFHDSIISNFQSLVYVVHSKAGRMLFRLERSGIESYYDREYRWLRLLKDISGLFLGDVDRAKYMKVNIRNAGRFLNKSDIADLIAYPSTTREFLYREKLWCLMWEICKISENFTI